MSLKTVQKLDGIRLTWVDGTTGQVRAQHPVRYVSETDAWLASLDIESAKGTVHALLSVDTGLVTEPDLAQQVEQALRAYCARSMPKDGFFLHADAVAQRQGISFVEIKKRSTIC